MLTGLLTTVHKIYVPYANINNKIWHMLVSPKSFSFVSAVILQIQFSIMVWTKLMEALVVLIKYIGDTSCKAPLENFITYSDIYLRASRFLSRMSKRWPYICCFGSSNRGVDLCQQVMLQSLDFHPAQQLSGCNILLLSTRLQLQFPAVLGALYFREALYL